MILLAHILIALSSIFFTGFTSFFPSKKKLTISYISVMATIATGAYLIVSRPSHMVTTCFEGLLYIGVVTVGIIIAQKRLSPSPTENQR